MKNIRRIPLTALRLRFRARRRVGVGEALSPFQPVGWCGGVSMGGAPPEFCWGGWARAWEARTDRDTIFRVASVSKVFGSAAAVRLAAAGRLPLDGDIAEILGYALPQPITLRQLLTHTAALDDAACYDRVAGTPDQPPLREVLQRSFLPYAPGTAFRYSNLGAGVVGMLIEKVTGRLFDDTVREMFFLPHGMDASFHPQRIVHKERMADCYRVPGNILGYDAQAIARQPLDEEPDPERHYSVPAGKLMISAPDLLAALARLPQEDPALLARQDHIGSVHCDAGRGLGLAIMPPGVIDPDRTFWGHQGAAYGAIFEAWTDPADGTTVVLCLNGARRRVIAPLYLAGQNGLMSLLDQRAGRGVY